MIGGAPPPQGKMSRLLRERADGTFAVLGDDEYMAIRRLLSESAGMVYDEKRREVLRLHLRDRAVATGCASFTDYVELAISSTSELQALWNQVVIHQTEFFRNRPQFEGLRQRVLPEVIRHASKNRELTIWSAGCSSGEEPYSLAITVLEALGDEAPNWRIRVHASDISTAILERASSGRYDQRHVTGLSESIRSRWFDRRGDAYFVSRAVRDLVSFAPHNLSADPAPCSGAGDVVFCCNVTIYFSKDALHKAIGTLESALRPGGYLFLGHSESLWRQPHHLELVDLGTSFVYRMPYRGAAPDDILPAATSRITVVDELQSVKMPAKPEPADLPRFGQVSKGPTTRAPKSSPAFPAQGRSRMSPSEVLPEGDDFESAVEEVAALRESTGPLAHAELAEVVATAQGHLERGQVEEVVELVSAALGRAPTEAALHFLLGSAEQRLGQDDAARASFDKAVYCDPTFSLAYFYRAMLMEAGGEEAQALLDYRNALKHLEEDHEGKWDGYLESMSHDALTQLCVSKIEGLEGGGSH